jgi:hypothetical protein
VCSLTYAANHANTPKRATYAHALKISANQEIFIREVVEGCLRNQLLLSNTLDMFHKHTGAVYLKHEYYQFSGGLHLWAHVYGCMHGNALSE